ncbi:MAG: SH3 domain-containing protein [Bacteroidota bacterium]
MKKFIIFALTIYILPHVYSQLPLRNLAKGIHAVYGDNVLIRNAPNQQGSIKHILPIGTKVGVIQKASKAEKISNIDDYWYQVIYDLDTGYIWGALISDIFLEDDLDGDSVPEIFLTYCNTYFNGSDWDYMLKNSRVEFRVAKNDKKISELKFRTNNQYLFDSAFVKTFNLFSPPLTAICLTDSFMDGNIGNGEFYLRFHDNTLDSLFKLDIYAGEGGAVHKDKLILPDDHAGNINTLIIERAEAYIATPDYNPAIVKWEYSKWYYKWDGKKIIYYKSE